MAKENEVWLLCDKFPPKQGVTVETKIDDEKGCRNVQELKLVGRMWYMPDGSMYVYYKPTHWRPAR